MKPIIVITSLLTVLAACGGSSAGDCAAGAPCACGDGSPGVELCDLDGAFAACVCADDPGCPTFSEEHCDGLDNDCNGSVDDREVCPDTAVTNTAPFTGGVHLLGDLSEGQCGTNALQRFWPTQATTHTSGFECLASWYRFRRSDNALFYHETFSGIRRDTDSVDPVVPTPPCEMFVGRYFDFDAANTLYYQCDDSVRRGDGAVVAQPISTFVGTLDDGRIIATRSGEQGIDFVVLDASGSELSRLSPFAEFTGTMRPAVEATVVTGNRAQVAYLREFPSRKREIVAFRVDESSTWSRIRRVEVREFGFAQLVLSDGTIFVREPDRDNRDGATERIIALLPDATTRTVWREVEQTVVRAHIGNQLLIGPP